MLSFLLILLVGITKASSLSPRVLGGSDASPGEYPFVVQIVNKGQHWCSGFIYNEMWIVTTATCVLGYETNPDVFEVIVGQVSLSALDPDEEVKIVTDVYIHEDFDRTSQNNNVAMLRLSTAITFGKNVNVGMIGNLSPPDETIVLGWADAKSGIIENLKYTTLPIQSNDLCSEIYILQWNPNTMICAGNGTNDACNQGDAGGPMIQGTTLDNRRVVGLVSHTKSCANPHYPTVYTRLSSFSVWMENKAGLQTPIPEPPVTHQCAQAKANQFPFIVSISTSSTFEHLCSGFIYNHDYIVTAASCLIKKSAAMINVTVGQLRFDRPDSSEKTYPVASIHLHPKYLQSNNTNNIALIKILGSLTFVENAISFIYYESADYSNRSSTVTGWAPTLGNGCQQSLSLLWDDSKLIETNAECSSKVKFDGTSMICRSKTGDELCEFEIGALLLQGDPAAPVVVGIKSVFDSCSFDPSSPVTIYTRISYYFNWILGIAGYPPLSI